MRDSIHVLHVDDESDLLAMTADFLRDVLDVTLTQATSVDEAVERLADSDVECVLSDYNLPDATGIEFLETVRESDPRLPFILYTGRGSEEVASDAISAGVTDYLQKQADSSHFDLLANRIENTVAQYRAEREMASQRTRYRTLVEEASDVILVVQPDGEIAYASPASSDILGRTPEELIGTDGFDPIHPDDRERVMEHFTVLLEDPSTRPAVEFRYRTADGSWIWAEARGRNLIDDPDIGGIVVYTHDVTGRKDRERELERYEAIVNSTRDIITIVDEDGTVQYESPSIEAILGRPPVEFEGEVAFEFMHPEDRPSVKERFRALVDEGDPRYQRVEFRIEDADGEWRWLEAQASDRPTPLDGYVISSRDITARKEREAALERLHSATRDLLNATTAREAAGVATETAATVLDLPMNGIHFYDEAGDALVPVAWSDATDRLFEDGPPAIHRGEGLAWTAFEANQPSVYEDVTQAPGHTNEDTVFRSELHLPLGPHGVFLAGSTTPASFDATDDALARILAANLEAALDRIEREADLSRQNERLEEFTEIVSHDLRNPLNVAQGRLALAMAAVPDPEHLSAVEGAHERMEALIDELLELAQEGVTEVEYQSVRLGDVAAECWSNVPTLDAELVVATERTVTANRTRLEQLVENLLRNAVDHGGRGVTVTVGDLDDGFYVEDDGKGIPGGDRETVLESGYSGADEGTGLGLAIVSQIVEDHGWDLSITESAAGGVRVEVTGLEGASPGR